MKKKITVLVAMMGLMMFAAVPAFAQTITVDEGDVTLTRSTDVSGSIVQNGGASVTFGDENTSEQSISGSQNLDVTINGDDNSFEAEQSIEQSAFSPSVSTDLTQIVSQSFVFYPFWVYDPFWGMWFLVYYY